MQRPISSRLTCGLRAMNRKPPLCSAEKGHIWIQMSHDERLRVAFKHKSWLLLPKPHRWGGKKPGMAAKPLGWAFSSFLLRKFETSREHPCLNNKPFLD